MYCKTCGKVVPDGTNYCSQCAEEIPSVGFFEAAKLFFTNYSNFSGRARRSEYWWASVLTGIVSGILSYVLPIAGGVWTLVILIPSIAITVRRLHDIGKSGWCYLVGCIPLVGQIMMLVWACTDSKEDNQWGANPKYRPIQRRIPKAQPVQAYNPLPGDIPLTAVPTSQHRMPDSPAIPVPQIPMPPAFSATLILCTGPMAGRQFTYRAGDRIVFGRSSSANVVLNGYDKVSGTHCRVEVGSNSVTVTDLGSTNGTKVGGQALTPNTPVTVPHGGILMLADNNCAFQVKYN